MVGPDHLSIANLVPVKLQLIQIGESNLLGQLDSAIYGYLKVLIAYEYRLHYLLYVGVFAIDAKVTE